MPNESRSRAELRVDHRAFVDHDEARRGTRAVLVEGEGRRALGALARPVDQRVDGRRAGAAVGAHHHRRLAGEGGEGGLAVGALGDMAGERRLADAGVAEQAEHLRLAGLQPPADPVDRLGLFARPFAPDRLRGAAGAGGGGRALRTRPRGFAAVSPPRSAFAPQREQVGGLRPRS